MPITVIFDPPLPSDTPEDFDTKAFDSWGKMNTFATEINALAADVNTKQTTASGAATTATTQAGLAADAKTAAELAASAALGAYDSFDDRYLGPKAADPTLDNDGNALIEGALYWNTVAKEMRAYNGTAWVMANAANAASRSGDTFTGNVNVPSLNGGQLAGLRNKLINGNFDVWQRGTSFVAPNSVYTADRWFAWTAQTAITIARTARPAGYGGQYAMRVSASSGTSSLNLGQPLEAAQAASLAGKTVTFSFMAVASAGTQAIDMAVLKNATADVMVGGSWSAVSTVSKTLTTTPQKFSITVAIPSDGTANGLLARITKLNIASGVNFDFWDFQVEVGDIATPFECRPLGLELALCQRYYYRVQTDGFCAGAAESATLANGVVKFPVSMRAVVTGLEQSGTASHFRVYDGAANITCGVVPVFLSGGVDSTFVRFNVPSGLTTGRGVILRNDGANGYLGFSAEL